MDDTKGLILATVIVTAATTFVAQASGKKPLTFRPYLAASFVGIFLTGMGMVNETLARDFAVLIILGVLLKNGGAVFTFAATSTKPKKG